MKWLPFAILAYVIMGLHMGLRTSLPVWGATPDLVCLAVVFLALNAPRNAALAGALALGFLEDLFTIGPLGLTAFTYGLVAASIVPVQHVVYREHPLTQFVLALFAGAITVAVTVVHRWAYMKLHPGPVLPPGSQLAQLITVLPRISTSVGTLLLCAVYTAVLAPVVVGVLTRTKRVFGFKSDRQAGAGMRGRTEY